MSHYMSDLTEAVPLNQDYNNGYTKGWCVGYESGKEAMAQVYRKKEETNLTEAIEETKEEVYGTEEQQLTRKIYDIRKKLDSINVQVQMIRDDLMRL